MTIVEAIFLGFIQGLTEFLPVSSSGHLVVFQKILGQVHHDIFFDVSAHVGTLVAVVIVFRQSISKILRPILGTKLTEKKESLQVLYYIFLASLPTALIGFFLKDIFEGLFSNIKAVGIFFFVTAAVLVFTLRLRDKTKAMDMMSGINGINTMSPLKALVIGFAQAFAICPGVSRAGMTIATALFLGVRKDTATLFSFLIAIPAILGALLLMLIRSTWETGDISIYIVGFFSAFIFGYIGLKALIAVVRNGNLAVFSLYLVLIGTWCLL